jgi:Cu2+-exporting ATPase
LISYDPSVLRLPRLVRLAEEALDESGGWGRLLPEPIPTRLGLANANLGIAALADFVIPALMPVSAILLIGPNLGKFRAAFLQVRNRKLGLPALYTVIVAATLASGRFLAMGLISWFVQFWHGRLGRALATERLRLLDECLPLPRLARLVTHDGGEVLVPVDRLRTGDRVVVGPDEAVPADGRVIEGEGIIDERSVRGLEGASRKGRGDAVLAGSMVVAGSLRIEVAQPADRARALAIGRALVAATSPAAGPEPPRLRAEAFADRIVAPTLATAGVGLLVGDLAAALAILDIDYATGPGVAGSLETLRAAARCARQGIVVRAGDAFERLAEVDLIVLDDSPALRRSELVVVGIQTRLPQADLLRYAASAFRHVADVRATALAAACRDRRVHLLDLKPVGFDPGVTVVHHKWSIRVRESGPAPGGAGPLIVEIDGQAVGLIEFGRSSRPAARAALERFRDLSPVPIVLVSDRSEADVAALASALGVDIHHSSLAPDETARLLRACRERGLRTAFVGDCRLQARSAAEAFVALSLGGDTDTELDADPAAVLLLQPRLELFADLWAIARAHAGRVRSTQRFILLPNLLCVAGVFVLGITALTAVVVSNLGTLGLYTRAVGALRALDCNRPAAADRVS